MKRVKTFFEKPMYEYFDDSDIEDFGDESFLDGMELDDAVEIDRIGDVDPLEIEGLLEEEEFLRGENEQDYTQKCDIEWKRQNFKSQIIPFEPKSFCMRIL